MQKTEHQDLIVIGGGAAGFFTAINAAIANPKLRISILERGNKVLGKVKVSGGGRCNVTHACFVPNDLVKFYPRGEKELLGPFNRFCTGDTIEWFEKRGVPTKIEADGRMFPTSNDSQTIVDCLWNSAKEAGIKVIKGQRLVKLIPPSHQKLWEINTATSTLFAKSIMLSTGSNPKIWTMLEEMGHTIVPPVPSLFTFNIKDKRIKGLLGLSVPNAEVKVLSTKLQEQGPLLITHWGMSGPAILKLSAWGARDLNKLNYQFKIQVNWLYPSTASEIKDKLTHLKNEWRKKKVFANTQFSLPLRLWKSLVTAANIPEEKRWSDLSKKEVQQLAIQLTSAQFQVNGKSTFKEEFVTAGGVKLKEVNFKTFESRLFKGLYFAGEVLDIDAITGGFNFQAAWTGGWIAGSAIGEG